MSQRHNAEPRKPLPGHDYIDETGALAAREAMPRDSIINALAETFRALSAPTRVRIISALSRREMCVNDLSKLLGLTGSAVSHQLRLLRGQRLVRYRKEGKVVYYTLDDEHIGRLFAEGVRHVGGDRRLALPATLPSRPPSRSRRSSPR